MKSDREPLRLAIILGLLLTQWGNLFLQDLVKSWPWMDSLGAQAFQIILRLSFSKIRQAIEVEHGHHQGEVDHPSARSIRYKQAGVSANS